MAVLTGPQVAALVIENGFPEEHRVIMVAIAKAESGWRTDAINTANRNGSVDRGLFQINSVHGYDPARLLSDPRFNTQCAKRIYDSQGLKAWSTYNADKHVAYMPEASQAVANAGGLTGMPPVAGSDPAANQTVVYGPPGPESVKAGKGFPLEFNAPTPSGALGEIRILGTQIAPDLGLHVIGEPVFRSAMDIIPHLSFSVIDPGFAYANARLFDAGNRVTWRDLDMRTDTASYIPGDHGQGQVDVVAEDFIIHALKRLRGPHTASNLSATTWLYQELSTVGMIPDRFLLGESVPTQTTIARDIWDPAKGAMSEAEIPSAWTTIVRLGKELGKWVFISGRRIIFGSAQFAMMWAAAEPVRIGWEHAPEHEAFVDMPTAERTTIVERVNTLRIKGRVPHVRAHLFRPGCAVDVYGIMGLSATAAKPHRMMVTDIEHVLATDVDGADVVLIEPVDPPPKPPGTTDPNGANPAGAPGVTGGGASGQVEEFVRICLSQTGKRYIFGAEASASDPNPSAFDCSELVEWAARRAGIPGVPDGSSAQINACISIPVEQAINTRGALLWHTGHIAVSLGNGRTIEASTESRPVGELNARGRFARGGLLRNALGYPSHPDAGNILAGT